MDDRGEQVAFLGRCVPAAFDARVIMVAPGGVRAYDRSEWRDAIVVVEHGVIELEWECGLSHQFKPGDILWLDGLGLRALHQRGPDPVLLVVVSRRRRIPHNRSGGRSR